MANYPCRQVASVAGLAGDLERDLLSARAIRRSVGIPRTTSVHRVSSTLHRVWNKRMSNRPERIRDGPPSGPSWLPLNLNDRAIRSSQPEISSIFLATRTKKL